MPPKKPSPPNVANLSNEQKISWLVHEQEGLQDWRLMVDERLERGEENSERLNQKVDRVDSKLGDLSHKMEERHSQLILIQQQVLIAVQGQRIPGMEVPGLSDMVKALQSELTGMRGLYDELKTESNLRKGWVAGAMVVITAVATGLGWYFYDKFHALMQLLDHPATKP